MNNRSYMFIEFFERHIFIRILSLFFILLGGIFGILEKLHDWISKNIVNDVFLQFTLSTIGALAIFGIVYLVIDCFNKKRKNNNLVCMRIISNPTEVFENELSQSSCVRIFASNGESAKNLFLAFHRSNLLNKSLKIQVLLRSIDGDPNRDKVLENQVRTWKSDVDKLLSRPDRNLTVKTSFALYQCPVMLSGYIFDERAAMLAWYSRPSGNNRHRSLPNPPLIYLQSEEQVSKKLLDEAVKLFDCHFKAGKELK